MAAAEAQVTDDAKHVKVGDAVLVDHMHPGVVRFIGPVHTAPVGSSGPSRPPQLMVGVELSDALGSCDGSLYGVEYFRAAPEKGVFVKPHRVVLGTGDGDVADAKNHRPTHAEGQDSRVWNQLDNLNEQLSLQRSLQFQTVFGESGSHSTAGDGTVIEGIIHGLVVEKTYSGPVLRWPLTAETVLHVLEHFKEGHLMHKRFVLEIVHEAVKICAREATVQTITIPADRKLTVIGDIHGQLQDLYSIFTINELPSPENLYLFNGDFVDRGPRGVEVLVSILCFKVLFPEAVFLNRGNHETRQQNRTMGFEEEVLGKYEGPIGRTILDYIHHLFDQLPLCAIVQEKIFVVHGGLFPHDGVTLEHIRGMSRRREPPIHSPVFEDALYEAMLWSDPRDMRGRQISARGAGVEFGEDVTHDFLRTNRMALVIRSHECVHEGFQLLHSGRLITLFSASRYCGLQTNKGAFLTIGPALQPEIQQFYAHALEDSHWEPPSVAQLEARLQEETVAMIVERIVDAKPSLFWHYSRVDVDRSGLVTKAAWDQGLKLVLQMDLPFLDYQAMLADAEDDGSINYTKFLERYQVEIGNSEETRKIQDALMDDICEHMFKAMGASTLAAAFDIFDVDGDGFIEFQELMDTLKTLDIGLSDAQIYELMRSLDSDANGKIDREEFDDKFDIVFKRFEVRRTESTRKSNETMPDGPEPMDRNGAPAGSPASRAANGADATGLAALTSGERATLRRIGAMMVLHVGSDLEHAFEKVRARSDGAGPDSGTAEAAGAAADVGVTMDALLQFLEELGAPSITHGDAAELRRHIELVDGNRDGRISRAEFLEVFHVDRHIMRAGAHSGEVQQDWQNNVLQQMANFFFQNRAHLASTFRSFDVNNDGQISAEEWKTSMLKINSLFKKPLTDGQIMSLMKTLDADGDGHISYQEFLTGFRIVDAARKANATPV